MSRTLQSIQRCSGLSLEEFRREFAEPEIPVILTDVAQDWPAMNWTPESLAEVAPEVEVQCVPTASADREAVKMTLREYVEYLQAPDQRKLYMINWAFEPDHPQLMDDFEVPIYFRDDWLREVPKPLNLLWIFLGPADSGLYMHIDVGHTSAWNVQITGSKAWKLWPPDQEALVYGGKVDAFDPDLEKFPRFAEARALETVVEPGECIYVPPRWWHQTKNIDAGLALTANYCDWTNHTRVLDYLRTVPEYRDIFRALRRVARRKTKKRNGGNG